MRARKTKPGFILLMVLAVLAVGGTMLAIAARRCGQDAIRAGAAQRDLQVRWGQVSCQATLLPVAGQLLQEQDDQRQPNCPAACEVRQSVTLGELTFTLIVGDENAKANVNVLNNQTGGENTLAAQAALRDSLAKLQADDLRPLPAQLRPLDDSALDDSPRPIRYPTYDRVLALNHPFDLAGNSEDEGAAIRRRMTCWGSGQLNLRRAELPAMQAVLGPYLNNAQMALLDQARAAPKSNVQTSLSQLQLTKSQMERVSPLVTDASDSCTLWIIAQGRNRSWYRLCVIDGSTPNEAFQQRVFVWQ